MAIRWKRDPKSTGLAAVVAGPRGWHLEDSTTGFFYMFVSSEGRSYDKWRFWVCRPGNTNLHSKLMFETGEAAKAAADKYWKANRGAMEAERAEYEANRITTRS